jgi:DNA repair exonuclease SbcCD nuclease subunit
MPVTFLHTSDFHLGADLRRFGNVAKKLSAAQFRALEKVLREARARQCAFVLICGDLFDSPSPGRLILKRTARLFASHPDVRVFLLPGTHDYLSETSVLHSRNAGWAPDCVTILNDEVSSPLPVSGGDTFLYFRPNSSNKSSVSPLAGLLKRGGNGHHIGLAHGSLEVSKLLNSNDFVIATSEIEQSGFDYLALGHWHKPRIEEIGRTIVSYPGVPQPLRFSDPSQGRANIVTMAGDLRPLVSQVSVFSIELKKLAGRIYHPVELERRLAVEADSDKVVKLAFSYSDNCVERAEIEKIVQSWKSRFLQIMSDSEENPKRSSSLPEFDSEDANPLVQVFLDELEKVAELEGPDRRHLYDRAADLGVKLIQGGFDAIPSSD